MSESKPRTVVCSPFAASDLETVVEPAMKIMGDGTLGAFIRTCTLTLSKAILEASADADIRAGEGSWSRSWIGDATIERKP